MKATLRRPTALTSRWPRLVAGVVVACGLALWDGPGPTGSPRAARAQTPLLRATTDPLLRPRLEEAWQAFDAQEWAKVVDLLFDVVNTPGRLSDTDRLMALERLGVAYWFEDRLDSAKLVFTQLLQSAPEHTLDPLFYPAPLVGFFDDWRDRLVARGAIEGPGGPGPGGRSGEGVASKLVIREIVRHDIPPVAYLMPFGVGQFANGEPAKGALVASLQGIGLAASVGGWLGVQLLKEPDFSGPLRRPDQSVGEVMQGLWIAGVTLAAGAWLYSVIDGFVNAPPDERVTEREEVLPPAGDTTDGADDAPAL